MPASDRDLELAQEFNRSLDAWMNMPVRRTAVSCPDRQCGSGGLCVQCEQNRQYLAALLERARGEQHEANKKLALEVGIECHTQGRIYSEGGEVDPPGKVYEDIEDYVERQFAPPPTKEGT